MRLIYKQKHKLTCAPVAYVNSCRLLGRSISYDYAVRLFGGLSGYKAGNATPFGKFESVARSKGFKASYKKFISYNSFKKFQKRTNGAICIIYAVGTKKQFSYHIVLILGNTLVNSHQKLNQSLWNKTIRLSGRPPRIIHLTRSSTTAKVNQWRLS